MRLMREVLPRRGEAAYPRRVRPADRGRGPQCRALWPRATTRSTRCARRRSASWSPHFEHKLFLSATPHNGYPESFTALLEMLDNQRFARGVQPDRGAAARGHGAPAEVRAAEALGRHASLPQAHAGAARGRLHRRGAPRSTTLLQRYSARRLASTADGEPAPSAPPPSSC